jgi:hypothetical protein
MNITIDDRARLMPLLRSAIGEARMALAGKSCMQPDRPEDLADSLEWGEDMLRRLEALDD